MKLTVKQLKRVIKEAVGSKPKCGDRSGPGMACMLPKDHPGDCEHNSNWNDPNTHHSWAKKPAAPRSFLDAHKKMSETDGMGTSGPTHGETGILPGVEKYLGNVVDDLQTKEDPRVPGTVAVRATVDGNSVDFIIVGYSEDMSPDDVMNNLEEVEFSTWPPRSGELRF